MKYKLTIIILLITGSIVQVYGQERTNREKLIFETTSGALLKAKGWAYNSILGEWIDYENVICDDDKYKVKLKSLLGAYMMSYTIQNFLKVQTRTVTYNEIVYYVLIVDKWNGSYEYPTIKENWNVFKETIGYIFTKDEYQKLFNIESLVELKTQSVVKMGSKYEKYDEIKFLDLIQSELSSKKRKYPLEYTFPIMKSKEGAIRFYFPDSFSAISKYDFEKKYFEADFEKFMKIILK